MRLAEVLPTDTISIGDIGIMPPDQLFDAHFIQGRPIGDIVQLQDKILGSAFILLDYINNGGEASADTALHDSIDPGMYVASLATAMVFADEDKRKKLFGFSKSLEQLDELQKFNAFNFANSLPFEPRTRAHVASIEKIVGAGDGTLVVSVPLMDKAKIKGAVTGAVAVAIVATGAPTAAHAEGANPPSNPDGTSQTQGQAAKAHQEPGGKDPGAIDLDKIDVKALVEGLKNPTTDQGSTAAATPNVEKTDVTSPAADANPSQGADTSGQPTPSQNPEVPTATPSNPQSPPVTETVVNTPKAPELPKQQANNDAPWVNDVLGGGDKKVEILIDSVNSLLPPGTEKVEVPETRPDQSIDSAAVSVQVRPVTGLGLEHPLLRGVLGQLGTEPEKVGAPATESVSNPADIAVLNAANNDLTVKNMPENPLVEGLETGEIPSYETTFSVENASSMSKRELQIAALDKLIESKDPKWKNRAYIAKYLLQHTDLNLTQISGMIGNFCVEVGDCRLNSAQHQDGGNAIGIAQWDDRKQALLEFAKKHNMPWYSLKLQAMFIVHELKGSEGGAYRRLLKAETVEKATDICLNFYERPAARILGLRLTYAKSTLKGFQRAIGKVYDAQQKAAEQADEPTNPEMPENEALLASLENREIVKYVETYHRIPEKYTISKSDAEKIAEYYGVKLVGKVDGYVNGKPHAFIAAELPKKYSHSNTITSIHSIGGFIGAFKELHKDHGLKQIVAGGGFRTQQRQIELRKINGCPDVWHASANACGTPTARPGHSMHQNPIAAVDVYNKRTGDYLHSGNENNPRKRDKEFRMVNIVMKKHGFKNLHSEGWHFSGNGH